MSDQSGASFDASTLIKLISSSTPLAASGALAPPDTACAGALDAATVPALRRLYEARLAAIHRTCLSTLAALSADPLIDTLSRDATSAAHVPGVFAELHTTTH